MEVAIILIVVVAALVGWWLLNNQSTDAPAEATVQDDFDVRPPTSLEFEGSTAGVGLAAAPSGSTLTGGTGVGSVLR